MNFLLLLLNLLPRWLVILMIIGLIVVVPFSLAIIIMRYTEPPDTK